MAELNLKLDQVNEENAKMVGHNNHKQRIQKHMELKEENNHLREVKIDNTSSSYSLTEVSPRALQVALAVSGCCDGRYMWKSMLSSHVY